ncbi:MAG: hypothetical protein HQM08_27480 [Candidatus Riflebacteria bacterium]|nr:hypothetical protein [Candidatus Riflebacteria bacterium]
MSFSKQGNVFIIVICILGVIFLAATFFLRGTIEEGRHTQLSTTGIQATCLADAALERAMGIIASGINDLNSLSKSSGKADSAAVKFRLPLKKKVGSSAITGKSDELGADEQLDISETSGNEVILTKEDLLRDGNELNDLVQFMTQGKAKDWDAKVTMVPTKAFRFSPGKNYTGFKVPGVELPWEPVPEVKGFLEGKGYSLFALRIPDNFSWLNIELPVTIGGFTIVNINITTFLSQVIPAGLLGTNDDGSPRTLAQATSIDFLVSLLLNKVIYPGKSPPVYPIALKFNHDAFPKTVSDLWPDGVTIDNPVADDQRYLEKYGEMKITCEASITGPEGVATKRRIEAVKEFKVVDTEPPAPMYSCFIANLKNERLLFNDIGGDFYVNSYDYGGIWSKVKNVFTGSTQEQTQEELESREFPGLIRVNYTNPNNDPLLVNVSMIGDFSDDKVDQSETGSPRFNNFVRGIEALLMMDFRYRLALAGGKYNINAEFSQPTTSSNNTVPSGMAGSGGGANNGGGDLPSDLTNRPGLKFEGKGQMAFTTDILGALKPMIGLNGFNLVPNIGAMSTNVISLASTLALRPIGSYLRDELGQKQLLMPNCFQRWEMPYMGTPNSFYTIPTSGLGNDKTHFFGAGALFPTLTREVEGLVCKQYRQWSMCIVGLNPADRLPLLPFPPYIVPPPPLVIPIWFTDTIQTKYDYNLDVLKAIDQNNNRVRMGKAYDPAKVVNLPANLYTNEQYAKKATYFYQSESEFLADIPNRLTDVGGKKVFLLNGISYIAGSLGSVDQPFIPKDETGQKLDTLYVVGRGMIACGGNVYLGCDIRAMDKSIDERTVFTLMIRNGGLLVMPPSGNSNRTIEGSLYTEKGIYVSVNSTVHILGNWVTNVFNKGAMMGKVTVDYVSSRVRSSLGSLHPDKGKFDPRRYNVSISPVWSSWRAF